MTTAMMITSSPEDLYNLKITREIISFVLSILDQDYIDHNGSIITKQDIQNLDENYAFMHRFLLNPGFSSEHFLNNEEQS